MKIISFAAFSIALAATSKSTHAQEPSIYTNYLLEWGGKGYNNSGGNRSYEPGSCDHPLGTLTVSCSSGGELVVIDPSIDPTILRHDCVQDPNNKSETQCSSSDIMSTAAFECRGTREEELKLTATLHENTVQCGAEGAYAKTSLYLTTKCGDWIDLDDQCSAMREEDVNVGIKCMQVRGTACVGNKYACSTMGISQCRLSPSSVCDASLDEVTVTSVGQDYPTCVHSLAADGEGGDYDSHVSSNGSTQVNGSNMYDQCAKRSSLLEVCKIDVDKANANKADTKNTCFDDDAIDFGLWMTCFKTIDNCDKISNSVCSMKHCCLEKFVDEINCRTGCEIDCEGTLISSIAQSRRKNGDGLEAVYLSEVCMPDGVRDKSEGDDVNLQSMSNSAMNAQYSSMLVLYITAVIGLLI